MSRLEQFFGGAGSLAPNVIENQQDIAGIQADLNEMNVEPIDGQTIYVKGDSSKFYPVYFPVIGAHLEEVQIWRAYSEDIGGKDPNWNEENETHFGAMSARVFAQNGSWGGSFPVAFSMVTQNYTNCVGDITIGSNGNYTLIVWLRASPNGKGAKYHYKYLGTKFQKTATLSVESDGVDPIDSPSSYYDFEDGFVVGNHTGAMYSEGARLVNENGTVNNALNLAGTPAEQYSKTNHFHRQLDAAFWGASDINNIQTPTAAFKPLMNVNREAPNLFPHSNNANGILAFNTHEGHYEHQIGFNGDGVLWHRYKNGSDFSSWEQIYTNRNRQAFFLNRLFFNASGQTSGDIHLNERLDNYHMAVIVGGSDGNNDTFCNVICPKVMFGGGQSQNGNFCFADSNGYRWYVRTSDTQHFSTSVENCKIFGIYGIR